MSAFAPAGVKFGNSAKTNGRPINGEVSDYMMEKHRIVAMSPELGSNDIKTSTYYMTDGTAMKVMLSSNYQMVKHAVQTLLPHFNCTLTAWSQSGTTYKADFAVRNNGVGWLTNQEILLYFNNKLFNSTKVTLNGASVRLECTSTTMCKLNLPLVPNLIPQTLSI